MFESILIVVHIYWQECGDNFVFECKEQQVLGTSLTENHGTEGSA